MKVGDLWEIQFERGINYVLDTEHHLTRYLTPEVVHIHRIEELDRDGHVGVIHTRSFGWCKDISKYGYRRGITQASKERLLRYMAKNYRIENR